MKAYIGTDNRPKLARKVFKKVKSYLDDNGIPYEVTDGYRYGEPETTFVADVDEDTFHKLREVAHDDWDQDAVLLEDGNRAYLYWRNSDRPMYQGVREEHSGPPDYHAYTRVGDKYVTFTPEKNPQDTQPFFSATVQGDEKYRQKRRYEYEHQFKGATERAIQRFFERNRGPSDEHIATSIPTFGDMQVSTAAAVAKTYQGKKPRIVDIGGSEGTWASAVGHYVDAQDIVNLDPNDDMEKAFKQKDTPSSVRFEKKAFHRGWEGVEVYEPDSPFDVVHESMTFQFIDSERKQKIKEIADKYLAEDGIFLTEEKFSFPPEVYMANEALKDRQHKAKYYEDEQIAKKVEEVLVGMESGQVDYEEYKRILLEHFPYIEEYWTAGNFRGIVASRSREAVDRFLENLEPIPEAEKYTYKTLDGDQSGEG